jgi:hypothetical protein
MTIACHIAARSAGANMPTNARVDDDDVFYSCRNKLGAELHIYLEEGTYHKRLFRGPSPLFRGPSTRP